MTDVRGSRGRTLDNYPFALCVASANVDERKQVALDGMSRRRGVTGSTVIVVYSLTCNGSREAEQTCGVLDADRS